MNISYTPYLYNVAPAVFGLPVAVRYIAGSGFIVLQSVVGLPDPPFRLTLCTLASAALPGPNRNFTVYAITAVESLTNVLTISGVLEGTTDQDYAIGDLAGILDDAGAITDLNNLALLSVPTVIAGVVAAGNSQGTATQLVGQSSVQEVLTTAAGQGVTLPPVTLPSSIQIINIGQYSLFVYPYPGQTIYNVTSPATIPATPAAEEFTASSPTNWYWGGGSGGGSGTVTNVSIASANGFSGTVANATTTPAITVATTVTGVLKAVGGSLEAAVADTDYQSPITITTNGSSGPATFSGDILNIPQYGSGGGGGSVGPGVVGQIATFASTTSVGSTTTGIEIDQSWGAISSQSAGSGTVTLNLSNNNNFEITLTGNITVAFSGGNVGQLFRISFVQGGSGSYTVTYSGSTFKWANQTVPVLTTTVGGIDLLSFYCPSTNVYWGGVALPNIG